MPLVQATLKNAILSVFNKMKNQAGTTGFDGNTEFANGLSKAFKDFGESGNITTVDSGTIPSGVYVGAGTGSLKLDDTSCKQTILDACNKMQHNNKDDDYLAEQITTALSDMYGASNIVETESSGSATNPSGVVTPVVNASWKGTITISFITFESGLKSYFNQMKQKGEQGIEVTDDDLANAIATLLYTAVKTGVVNTQGSGDTAGGVGVGTIT